MRARLGVLVLLLALIVGSLAALAVLGFSRGALPFDRGDDIQGERDSVMRTSRDFMVQLNTYGPGQLKGKTMPGYRKAVAKLVTAKLQSDFEANGAPLADTTAQAGADRKGTVYSTGVVSLDQRKATALVAGEFTVSYPEKAGSTKRVTAAPQPFRVEVHLVRQEGHWLVDSFQAVTTGSGDQGATPAPSPSPTEGATR